MAYPPAPWSLRGRMYVSVFALRVRDLPPIPSELDGAVRVVRIGRRAFVGAAWVDYQPGGDMAYHELLAAVLMRAGLRPRVTITHIWVDSDDSRDGGRQLWGIPKQLAAFDFSDALTGTAVLARDIASATVRRRRGVRLPIGFRVTQVRDGKPLTTPVRSTASCGLARVAWEVDPGGPLGFLAGRRPLLSFAATDFRMTFGELQSPAVAADAR
jgi:hypothetical protein